MISRCTHVVPLVVASVLLSAAHVAAQSPTGIYVERWVPATGNPCGTSPPSVGDGWFPVTGFPNRGATCPGATPAAGLAYGSNVSFTGVSGGHYRVFAVSDAQPIGNITVSGSGFTLIVGRSASVIPPFTTSAVELQVAGGGTIGNVTALGGTVQVHATDSVGTVSAAAVVRVDARNSIGSVTSSGTIGTVRAPSLSAVSANGNITAVRVTNWNSGNAPSDLVSSVSSATGNITTIDAQARLNASITADQGNITTITSSVGVGPSSGSAITIRAMDGIGSIISPSINANIETNASGTGGIQTLTTSGGGSFAGSLQTGSIGTSGSGISISGALTANITIGGNVSRPITVTGAATSNISLGGTISSSVNLQSGLSSPGSLVLGTVQSTVTLGSGLAVPVTIGSIEAGGLFRIIGGVPATRTVQIQSNLSGTLDILGDLVGNVSINNNLAGTVSLPSNGLKGQITVSSGGVGAGGTWTGTVNVGSIALTPSATDPLNLAPNYARESSTLGGGSVGVAPFKLHHTDCTPDALDNMASVSSLAGLSILDSDMNDIRVPLGNGVMPPIRVLVRSRGPIQKGFASAWRNLVLVECRPYGTGVGICEWQNATSAFDIFGPGDTGDTRWAPNPANNGRTIGVARKLASRIATGMYRVSVLADESTGEPIGVLSANVTGNPAVD